MENNIFNIQKEDNEEILDLNDIIETKKII